MNNTLNHIIESADIPSLPTVLQEILTMADNPRTTSSQLEKLVVQEPGLSAQLLKWVNSALYSLPNKVSSISHAMILLGFSTVKSVASGMMLMDVFDDISGISPDYIKKVWKHTLRCANVIRILAHRETTAKKDDLFLAAMIHDVGHLVLSQFFQEKYTSLQKETPFPNVEDEDASLEINHAQVGAELLRRWNFPENVIEIVQYHHDPENYPHSPLDQSYLFVSEKLCLIETDEELSEILNTPSCPSEWEENLNRIKWSWDKLQKSQNEILHTINMVNRLVQ